MRPQQRVHREVVRSASTNSQLSWRKVDSQVKTSVIAAASGERGAEQQDGWVAGQPLHGGAGVYSGDRRARVDCAGMSEQATPISPGRQEARENRPELLAELDRRDEEILRLRDLLIGRDARTRHRQGSRPELEAPRTAQRQAARRAGPDLGCWPARCCGSSAARASPAVAAPRFSILTPVYETPAGVLGDARLGPPPELRRLGAVPGRRRLHAAARARDARRRRQREDPRIRVEHRQSNGGIVAASNDALAMADGEFVALLDHDDQLHPDALALVAEAIDGNPEADYVYTDEDKIDRRRAPLRRRSSSPTGRRSGCGRRCTPATSASCAARWSRRSAASTPSSRAPRTGTWC